MKGREPSSEGTEALQWCGPKGLNTHRGTWWIWPLAVVTQVSSGNPSFQAGKTVFYCVTKHGIQSYTK